MVESPVVDWQVLETWMANHGLPAGEIEDPRSIGGGTQNIMYRFRSAGAEYVLRRGPQHPRPHTDDALRREARILQALAPTPVSLPRLVAAETDADVLGSVFYLMEPVEGFNATVELPALHADDPAMQRRMGFAAVEALAKLGDVAPEAVGLADLGHPDGFLDRQVPQWLATLDRYSEYENYGKHQLPHIDDVSAWLTAHQPGGFTPGIMHGDYHLANLMYRNDSAEVAAIVDWEMSTVADPLLDLGWLLASWPKGETTALGGISKVADGLPTRTEIVEHYATVASRDIADARWYAVMASMKLGVVLEGTHARACAGKVPATTGDMLHTMASDLMGQAAVFIEHGLV